MFVVGLAAFRSAGVADFRAERTEAGVKLRSATHESCCCPANVGAVDAKARALFSDPETLVDAMLAFLSASNASVDAALVCLVCHNSDLSVFLLVAFTSLERSHLSCNRNTLRSPVMMIAGGFDIGCLCAMYSPMVRRLTIAVVVTLALVSTAVRLPAQSCALSMAPEQKMACGTDCCAKMKWCVIPQKEQKPPATAQSENQQSILLVAPAVQTLRVIAPIAFAKADYRVANVTPESLSRLAVLCTFLI
jgi:hypothetical protein